MASQGGKAARVIARGLAWICAIIAATLGTTALDAQQAEQRDSSIANLPRPGYEPRTIIIGSIVLQPTLDADVTYDNNILATQDGKIGDAIFSLSPRVTAQRKGPTLDIQGDVHADVIRYANHPRENVNTFGGALDVTKGLAKSQTIEAKLAFDRTYERRSDPEADLDRTRPPALINLATAGLTYHYRGARIGVVLDGTVSNLNYLPAADAGRDMTTYHASLQASLQLGKGMAVFVQPYVNRRDFRIDSGRASAFGDTTTTGVLAGVSFDLANRLEGNIGAGVFVANPDAAGIKTYTGVAANGRLVWHPRVRTAIVFDVFRGDAATVRAGALGRIDTRIGLAIDQEVRHNLLLHAAAGLRDIRYRGGIDDNQRYVIGDLEARYLLNRHTWLVGDLGYTHRTASISTERFDRWRATIGLRWAY